MMKHKILSLIAAISIPLGLFVAVPLAPAQTQQLTTNQKAAQVIIQFCRKSYQQFEAGDAGFIQRGMAQLDDKEKLAVALACYAYGEGYNDGVRWREGMV